MKSIMEIAVDNTVLKNPQVPLRQASETLIAALAGYRGSSAVSENPKAAAAMVESFCQWFTCALPGASAEILTGLTELCAIETARARLERQADAGQLPSARIVSVASR